MVLKLFDTHCHFETTDPAVIGGILSRAHAAGVAKLMAVGGSVELNAAATATAACATAHQGDSPQTFSGDCPHQVACPQAASRDCPQVVCALGYDRDQTSADRPPIPDDAPLAAWGEIGLDYHYSPETRTAQLDLFAAQLEEARRRNLPVVIHTREADDDTLGVLREVSSRGVIHCFTGTPSFARQLLNLGFYISISGIVTFRVADNVRESALVVPDDRLLIETDSPFLAPVPKRGQPNEPAFIAHTCAFLAQLRHVLPEQLAEQTFANAEAMLAV